MPNRKITGLTGSSLCRVVKKNVKCGIYSLGSLSKKRHCNPYATSLPVLIAIARLQRIQRVLEFGCGKYSTLSFTDQSAFPDVVKVYSFENDKKWADKIGILTSDTQINLTYVDKAMDLIASEIDYGDFDLIFIDDSTASSERMKTIHEVAHRCNPWSIVAIHDFEVYDYRLAGKPFLHHFAFTGLNPHTGIVWNKRTLNRRVLQQLNRLIYKQADRIEPESLSDWVSLFNNSEVS